MNFRDRLLGAWTLLTGRHIGPLFARIMFMVELTNTNAAIARLSASADRLIAQDAANAGNSAQAVADADNAAAASINAVSDKIDVEAPPAP